MLNPNKPTIGSEVKLANLLAAIVCVDEEFEAAQLHHFLLGFIKSGPVHTISNGWRTFDEVLKMSSPYLRVVLPTCRIVTRSLVLGLLGAKRL